MAQLRLGYVERSGKVEAMPDAVVAFLASWRLGEKLEKPQ